MSRNIVEIAILCMLLIGGCSKKNVQPVVSESVRYVDREVIRTVVDTVQVEIEIPAQTASIVTPDTVSHLETQYAESFAKWSGGLLTHELSNKPMPIKHEVTVPYTEKQKIVERTDTIREIEYVEKPPSMWTRFRCSAFWWLVILSGFLLFLIFR